MPTARRPAEILEYWRRSVIALRDLGRHFDALDANDRKAFPKTKEAFLEALRDMRDELDDEVVLALIASAEWVLRGDFGARLGDDDACGVRFNHLHERFDGKVPLDEILDVWKDLTKRADDIGGLKQMVGYRHGLAHGRYFNKSGLHHAEPRDADAVIAQAFDAMRACVCDFPRG